jgi:hypothetical protein
MDELDRECVNGIESEPDLSSDEYIFLACLLRNKFIGFVRNKSLACLLTLDRIACLFTIT